MSDQKGIPLKSPLHRLRMQREKKHCQEEVGHTVLFYSWCTLIYNAPVNGMPHYPYMGPMWGKVGIVPFEFQ